MTEPSIPQPPSTRTLARATLAAAAVAAVILVAVVLPAEYGIDPTGIGHWTGIAALGGHDAPDVDAIAPDDGVRTTYAMDARWRVTTSPLSVQQGYTDAPFGESRIVVPVNVTNLTSITATLTWDDADRIGDAATLPDEFEVGIDGPDGRSSQRVRGTNSPDGHGTISVTLPWRTMPAPERTADGIRFATPAPDLSGHGDWTITIRLYGAGGAPDPDDSRRDPGNNWTLTVTAESFHLEVTESEGFGGDRVTLAVNPGQGIEYKFHMRTGGELRYRWASSAPVYWDLHAEEDGKPPEDFVRFEDGTGASGTGAITASATGRHGWYFENRSDAQVWITLETTGDYTILGVV